MLIVRVRERAVDGAATRAVVAAVADAFGVTKGAVSLVAGQTSRTKVFDIEGGDPDRFEALLSTP